MIEFNTLPIEALQNHLFEEFKFKPVRHSYQILGYCESRRTTA